jgi:hypothetical protein
VAAPAAATTTMASASASTATTASAATPAAFPLWTRLVDYQRAAHKLPAVERGDYLFSFGIVFDFSEAKTAGLAGESISKESE